MKNWIIAICIVVGLLFGAGAGFILGILASASENPMLAAIPTTDGFPRIYAGMAKLSAYDTLARNCASDATALMNESATIGLLRSSAPSTGLHPELDLAEARWAVRISRAALARSDTKAAEKSNQRVERLLKQAGWKDGSVERFRALVQERDNCR